MVVVIVGARRQHKWSVVMYMLLAMLISETYQRVGRNLFCVTPPSDEHLYTRHFQLLLCYIMLCYVILSGAF